MTILTDCWEGWLHNWIKLTLTNFCSNFLITLCHTINVDSLTETCSKVTKNLLGTHLGNSAIHTMCGFMESSDERFDNETLVRGAVVLGNLLLQ